MKRLGLRTLAAVMSLALLAWVNSGCGGGGGGGGGSPTQPPPPVIPPSSVTFTADSQAVPGSVYLEQGQGSSGTVLVLEVRVMDVSDLYSARFDLEFPNSLLTFRKNATTEGEFLGGGGDFRTDLIVKNKPAGNLVIGFSRIGDVEGAEGSGTLFSLEFGTDKSGSGSLNLKRHDTFDPNGEVQSGVTWIGGSIDVHVQSN